MNSRSIHRRITAVVLALLAVLAAGCQATGNPSKSDTPPGTSSSRGGYS